MDHSYLCILVTFVLAITIAANAEIFLDADVDDSSEADVVPKNRTSFPVRLIDRELTYFAKECVKEVEKNCSEFGKYEKPRKFTQCAFSYLLTVWDRCYQGHPTTVRPIKNTTPAVTTTDVEPIKSSTPTITTTASSVSSSGDNQVPKDKITFPERVIDRTLAYFSDECVEEAKKRCNNINRRKEPRKYTRCTIVNYLIPIWQRCIKIH